VAGDVTWDVCEPYVWELLAECLEKNVWQTAAGIVEPAVHACMDHGSNNSFKEHIWGHSGNRGCLRFKGDSNV